MTDRNLPASAAVYSPLTLRAYDLFVVHFSARFAWGCPSSAVDSLYQRNIGSVHLDVGPGTGYFLNRCAFPGPNPQVTLLDINTASLHSAARRIKRYAPTTVIADALRSLPLTGERFDSAAANYLLHCLPGTLKEKAVLFDHLLPHMKPGGKVFGSTILGQGVKHNWLGRKLMKVYNRKGIFGNAHDDLAELDRELGHRFTSFRLQRIGTIALFEAMV